MLVTTLLLTLAAVLLLRAARVRVHIGLVPFPPEAPAGMFGVHFLIVRVPAGIGFKQVTQARKATPEEVRQHRLH